MNVLLKISQQTLWQVLGKIITSFSTFIILGLITRKYHEAGTGVFTLSLTYLAIFNLLSDFGFNAHVLRKFKVQSSKFKVEWQKLLGTRILWSLVLGILSFCLLPFFSFATADFSRAVLFGSISILGAAIFTSCNLIFQSNQRYDLSVFSSSIGTLIGLVLYFWLSYLSLPIPYLLVVNSITWLIIAFSSLMLVKKIVNTTFPVFDFNYIKKLFKDSWPIAATLTLNVIYFRADSFMISFFQGVSQAGVYNLAYSIFQTVLVLPTFIMNAYYPLMLKSLAKVRLIGVGLFGLAALATLLTLVLSPTLINILTVRGFQGADLSLQILSLSFPAFFLSSLLMWRLLSDGRYKAVLLIYMLGLVFNLILNFIYIPQFSYIAASWITVISEFAILVLLSMVLWFRSK